MRLARFFSVLVIIAVAAACDGGGGGSSSSDGSSSSAWSFTEDNVDFGITNIVSPEAVRLSDGSVRLYTTGEGAISVYTAADGLTFSQTTASPPMGSDPTLIQLSDGSWRMYYVDHASGSGEIKTATSPDGLTFTTEAATGITNTTGTQAWGVPDTIALPDGSVRVYWVDTVSGSSSEVIRSAISTDGVTFTEESGYRTTGGYVDPVILKAEDGDWVALFSTGPGLGRQIIYVGTSSDGLTWSIESSPVITVSGGNALDPAAVDLGDGSYRVYYIATTGSDSFSGFYLSSGVLARR